MDAEENKEETQEESREEEDVKEEEEKEEEDASKAEEDMVVLEATGDSEAIEGMEAEGGDENAETEPEQSMAEAMAEATEVCKLIMLLHF